MFRSGDTVCIGFTNIGVKNDLQTGTLSRSLMIIIHIEYFWHVLVDGCFYVVCYGLLIFILYKQI